MKAQYMSRLINQISLGGRERLLENIIAGEIAQGHTVLRPGEVEWFSINDWRPSSVLSVAGNRVRLVLVEAKQQKNGAFKRLLDAIEDEGLLPVVVEPHDRLAMTLAHWGWKSRVHGQGETRETIWYPRP